MFAKSMGFAKGAMLLVALVTLVRFLAEAIGVPLGVTRFISATVVILAVPIYFGFRAARGALSGYGELALAGFLFALWGEITVAIATIATGLLQVQTHYLSAEEMATSRALLIHTASHLVAGVVLGLYAVLAGSAVYAIAKRGRAPQASAF